MTNMWSKATGGLKFIIFLECKVERSSDQIIKSVNMETLTMWVVPDDMTREMPDIVSINSTLVYDPYANPPDTLVSENTRRYVTK